MKHPFLPIIRTVALLALGAYLAACTSAEVRQNSGSAVRGIRVSTISVSPAAKLHADDVAFLRENQVEDTLSTAIRTRLAQIGKLQPTGATLDVKISSVRVRSTASVVMLGLMAGPDHLDANVAVVERGQVVKTFVAEGNHTSSGFAAPGSLSRVERLSEELAIAIADQL